MNKQVIKAALELIGQQIKEKREQLKLTQLQVAEAMDVSQTYIARIENGQQNITIETFLRLLYAMNCNFTISIMTKAEYEKWFSNFLIK